MTSHSGSSNSYAFDAFLAFPMASISEQAYKTQRLESERVECYLREYCGLKNIYNPAAGAPSPKEFDSAEISLQRALHAIRSSRLFIMLYTCEKPSSVLVEAGCALAHTIPSLYFVLKPLRLPFLLDAASHVYQSIQYIEYNDFEEVLRFFERNRHTVCKDMLT